VRIPAYWSKATAEETDQDGTKKSFSCWRWSNKSPDDAHQSALNAAKMILRSVLSGTKLDSYAYGERALREEVKQRFTNAEGELIAVISQNSYGSLVLGTAHVMFIDLDFPPIRPGESIRHFVRRLLDKSARSPDAQREQNARDKLDRFLADNPQWSVRVYRTCAGLRVIATHSLFDPTADSTQALLESLGTDPMYIRLCKAQDSFRARLTPKPWRCGHTSNTIGWPRETDDQRGRFEKWMADYLERQSNYATCRYLVSVGNAPIHPDVKTIIDIHDQTTRCHEPLALA
jgi:hypothetical protein